MSTSEPARTDLVSRLQTTLDELRGELDALSHQAPQLNNPEVQKLLATALAEIHGTLAAGIDRASTASAPQPAATSGAADDDQLREPTTTGDRLQLAATQFEQSHPTLSALLQNTVELLAQLGI